MWLKIIATICAISLGQLAQAQDNMEFKRKGFVFGTSLGGAITSLEFPDKSQNETDLAINLKVGYMLNPNLAILLTSNISIYDYSGFGRDRKRDFGVLAPSVQYWMNDKLWLLGGIGMGGDNPVFWDIKNPDTDPLETKYYPGLGLIGSVGYEIYQSKNNFTVDIKARTMYRKVNLQEGNTTGFSYGILIGINFY